MEVIARLTGVFGFLTLLEIYNRFRWLRSEYTVQSWWWGDTCLDLPANVTLCTFILAVGATFSIAMALWLSWKNCTADSGIGNCLYYGSRHKYCLSTQLSFDDMGLHCTAI